MYRVLHGWLVWVIETHSRVQVQVHSGNEDVLFQAVALVASMRGGLREAAAMYWIGDDLEDASHQESRIRWTCAEESLHGAIWNDTMESRLFLKEHTNVGNLRLRFPIKVGVTDVDAVPDVVAEDATSASQ